MGKMIGVVAAVGFVAAAMLLESKRFKNSLKRAFEVVERVQKHRKESEVKLAVLRARRERIMEELVKLRSQRGNPEVLN